MNAIVSFAGASIGTIAVVVGGLILLGVPVALFEGLFGRGPDGRRRRSDDRDTSARELYDRRLRDSHRR